MAKEYITNLNTFADLVDRLIVEVHKLAFFENKKREEHAKAKPNDSLISQYDNLSRDCCEYRSRLKNAINETLKEIVEDGEYHFLKEVRTFAKPPKSVAEILSDICETSANEAIKGELVARFKYESYLAHSKPKSNEDCD